MGQTENSGFSLPCCNEELDLAVLIQLGWKPLSHCHLVLICCSAAGFLHYGWESLNILKKKEDKMTINVHNPPCVWESSTWCQEDFPQLRYVSYVHTCNVSLAVLTEVVGFTQWSRDNNLSMGICLICRRKSEFLKASSCLGGEGKGNMLRHVFFSLL